MKKLWFIFNFKILFDFCLEFADFGEITTLDTFFLISADFPQKNRTLHVLNVFSPIFDISWILFLKLWEITCKWAISRLYAISLIIENYWLNFQNTELNGNVSFVLQKTKFKFVVQKINSISCGKNHIFDDLSSKCGKTRSKREGSGFPAPLKKSL